MSKLVPSLFPFLSRKLSEKTIELSACTQIGQRLPPPVVWFGLTQVQEHKFGFDAAMDLGGNAFILQYKASDYVLKNGKYKGCRRFYCQHKQLQNLTTILKGSPNSCFYFLPGLGSESELRKEKGDILKSAWLFDVASITKPIMSPGRAKDYHYFDLDVSKPMLTIHSEIHEPPIFPATSLFTIADRDQFPKTVDLIGKLRNFADDQKAMATLFTKYATLAVMPE